MSAAASNPYQPPVDFDLAAPQAGDDDANIPFCGSMTLEEGRQAEELLTGKPRGGTVSNGQILGLLGTAGMLLGMMAWEAIVYDEPDQLLEVALGGGSVAALAGACVFHRGRREAQNQQLKADQQGAFTVMAGRVTREGVDFLIEDFPVSYRWEDFAGIRLSRDTGILYVSYPKEVDYIAASMFSERRQWEQARERLQRCLPRLGRFPRLSGRRTSPRMTHISAGTQALNQEDWPRAVAEFEQALTIVPDDIQALRGRMVAAVAGGDVEQGWRAIQDVTTRGFEDAVTRRLRSGILILKRDYENALVDLNDLLQDLPEDPDLLRDRGLVYLKLGRVEDSLRDSQAALQRNAADFVAMNNLGAALLEAGRVDDAVDRLQAAIELAPPGFERPRELLAMAQA